MVIYGAIVYSHHTVEPSAATRTRRRRRAIHRAFGDCWLTQFG